jgi:hypothetical protein
MSEPRPTPDPPRQPVSPNDSAPEENSSPNLILLYALLALALLAAMGIAAAIVWPFYIRR